MNRTRSMDISERYGSGYKPEPDVGRGFGLAFEACNQTQHAGVHAKPNDRARCEANLKVCPT